MAQTDKFQRRVTDAIARSTAPLSALRGLQRIEQHQPANMGGQSSLLGTYNPHVSESWEGAGDAGPTVKLNAWGHLPGGSRAVRPGDDIDVTAMEHTLLHEIGHHAHYRGLVGEPNEYHEEQRNPGPVKEARAEAFGRDHWRQDPREARTNPRQFQANYDEWTPQEWSYDDKRKFNSIYHGTPERPRPPEDLSKHPQSTPLNPLIGAERGSLQFKNDPAIEGQGRLFSRSADAQETGHNRDYGQWPLYDPNEGSKPVDTIVVGRGPSNMTGHHWTPEEVRKMDLPDTAFKYGRRKFEP